MSHHPLRKLFTAALLVAAAVLPLGLLAGCSDGKKSGSASTTSNATPEDRRLKLKSDLTETQLRLTELEQRLTDLQNQQNRALEDVVKTTTKINKEFVDLKAEALALANGEAPTAAVNVSMLQPSDPAAIQTTQPAAAEPTVAKVEGPSKILRLILWVIVIIAIGFFVRLFIARKDEEFDDYDQAEESPDVKLNEYGSVQMPREAERPASTSTTDDDINQAGRP